MKNIAVKVSFRLMNSKLNKEKNIVPVYLRLRLNGQDKNLSTGIFITPSEWIKNKCRIKGTTYKEITINKKLSDLENKVYKIVNDIEHTDEILSLETIEMRLKGNNTAPTLIEMFDIRINEMNSKVNEFTKGTVKHYPVVKTKIINFLKQSSYNSADIPLNKLDFNFINRFDTFLTVNYKNKINTVRKNVKILKAVVNSAIKSGWINSDPFIKYTCKSEETNRQFLTKHEVERIENLDLHSERLSLVKDLFLFMCYTGISYTDMKLLTSDNIIISISGNTFLNFNRIKTNTKCNVRLLSTAKEILDKYKDHPIALSRGRLLPVISNQKMNRFLKEIGLKAEINKPLTCHVARHTFATISLEYKIPLETVSKVLGHRSLKTTQIYAKITPGKIEQDYAVMENAFGNNKLSKAK